MAEPGTVTIPGAPSGFNCKMTIGRYGSRLVRVGSVVHGPSIISYEGESRDARSFYPFVTTSSSFTLGLLFVSSADRQGFNDWMWKYFKKMTRNEAIDGYVQVSIPARRFQRAAVPEGSLEYGDVLGKVSFPASLSFIGATDPTSALGRTDVAGGSRWVAPTKDASVSTHFYPSGTQKAGAESLEGTIFDQTPNDWWNYDTPALREYTIAEQQRNGPIPQ